MLVIADSLLVTGFQHYDTPQKLYPPISYDRDITQPTAIHNL